MAEKTSVVTPERFAQGMTYQDYLAQITVNMDQFQKYYDEFQLGKEDAEFFRRAAQQPNGPTKMLVIGEDWCPDVYRGMPVMARIVEASGMEMRVFPRDANLDIMDEFLKQGEFKSVPVAVFYTQDHRYLCHWIERPVLADEERARVTEEVARELSGSDEQQVRTETRQRMQVRYPAWQQESAREMSRMLASKLDMD